MATATDRAVAAFEDVVAVEHTAPGMVRVVTVSDAYIVDARHEVCECPDYEYHLEGEGRCKHLWAALDATDQLPFSPARDLVDDLDQGPEPLPDFADFAVEGNYV